MFSLILATLILGSALLLQTTVIIHINMLYGAADLVLLALLGWTMHRNVPDRFVWAITAGTLAGLTSQQPVWLMIIGYMAIIGLALFLQNRIWDVELLTLFTTTLVGSFLLQVLTLAYRLFSGIPIPLDKAFNLIIIPGVILNLLLVLPIYGFLGEFTKTLYPTEGDA